MLINYLKMALRTIGRQKGYAAINLFGLAVGIACATVIVLYVQDELAYDAFHEDPDRIYRLAKDRYNPDVAHSYVPPALMPALVREMPEVESAVRLFQGNKAQLISHDKAGYESDYFYVDRTFFDLFSFSFLHGTAQSALTAHSSIVVTESFAQRYFGDAEALGKTIHLKTRNLGRDFQVSGVVEDLPSQSHFTFDFLLSTRGFRHRDRADTDWGDEELNAHTYIKLGPKADLGAIDAKIQQLVEANKPENEYTYSTQPLAGLDGIHLNSHRSRELSANSDRIYIQVLLLIALFVILIACINYINLATAKSAVRAKEIGVRRVVGALRKNLIMQFLAESILLAVIAGVLAIGLTETILPFFNHVMQKQLSLFAPGGQFIWLFVGSLVVAIGIITGLYPAIYLSAGRPTSILRYKRKPARRGLGFRRGLVVFQFSLAAFLTVGIIVIQRQLNETWS